MRLIGWHYKGCKIEHGQDWFQVICPATSLADVFRLCDETEAWELTTPCGVTDDWTDNEFSALVAMLEKRGVL